MTGDIELIDALDMVDMLVALGRAVPAHQWVFAYYARMMEASNEGSF